MGGLAGATLLALAVTTSLALALGSSAASARSEEVATAPSGVTFVSGGISTDAVDRLRAMQNDFNLKMVFATNNGEYLSDVKVEVVDRSNRVVLDTLTEGPWLLAKLPPGDYQVIASYRRATERRAVAVQTATLKTLDFRWPTE
jgi:putative Ca2+/H+ antiporter (TMEM165/GDT1 family)